MNIAATDGREVFTATCRTCHNTSKYQPEKDKEIIRAEALKKLARMRKRKEPRRRPEVVSRRKRVSEQSAVQATSLGASAEPAESSEPAATLPDGEAIATARSGATWGTPRKSIEIEAKDQAAEGENPRLLWRKLTASLGPRDGSPYVPERTYAAGDVMLHKRHGMGIVESIVHENACMVLFREDRKVIEMAQPAGG